jgi:hypothetical protein
MPGGLQVSLKWTKSIQGAHPPIHIPLPRIHHSPLCPVRAYHSMVRACPTVHPRMPLLVIYDVNGNYTPVSTHMLATNFHQVIHKLHLPPLKYSLHSLRKGGITLAHAAGISMDQIKSHGTWSSNTVWTYVKPSTVQKSAISQALAQAVTQ